MGARSNHDPEGLHVLGTYQVEDPEDEGARGSSKPRTGAEHCPQRYSVISQGKGRQVYDEVKDQQH